MSKSESDFGVLEELKPFINYNMLDLRDSEDFINILDILFAISREAVAEAFLYLWDCETIREKFQRKLLLKRILKK